ncbi:MAG TPA: ankyrin repeat domain-containing protein [Steroidobacteraceae bacterium]
MTLSKFLPARPSQESLRKQAKKLGREVTAGNADAIARVRAQLPDAELPLSQRDSQLVLAREYGFEGWQQLVAEVQRLLGHSLEWAASEARRIIHDNDVERLKQLLTEYPALLSWQDEENDGGLLGLATSSFGDSGDPERERQFTRAACAELLIDAGAVVLPHVCDGLLQSRTKGLLHLLQRKGVLPRSLKFRVALGDIAAVRACLNADDNDHAALSEAFRCACHFEYQNIASLLLDRLIGLDVQLGKQIDGGPGRSTLLARLVEDRALLAFFRAVPKGPWEAFLMHQIVRAIHDDELATFVGGLQRERWLLGDSWLSFQVGLIERATLRDRPAFIAALLDLDPALLRQHPAPQSQAIEFAFTYAKPHLLPMLTRIWPLPEDLPHAAGMGDLDRVKRWFDASGMPALGDLSSHFPCNNAYARKNLQWGAPSVQQALDTALAWSVLNRHLQLADFLLQHGADINTRWSSHEPASILHELVSQGNYEGMQFLIDRGIDMTIKDYRWGGTAAGWAYHALKNEKMAQWLADAQQRVSTRLDVVR